MTLFSPIFLSLLQGTKSSLLKFQSKVQDYKIFTIGIIFGFIVYYTVLYLTSLSYKLPPGPHGYLIIGNLLELRLEKWTKFTEW